MGQEDIDIEDLCGNIDKLLAKESSKEGNKELLVRTVIQATGKTDTLFLIKQDNIVKEIHPDLNVILGTYNKL